MRSLIIIYVLHAILGCGNGNVTSLERLYCDNWWLIGDVCLSSGCQNCEECDLCPIQDIEVVIDWFSAMMRGGIKISKLSNW